MSISIRYKFLLVTTLLLIVCVVAYLLMASTVFKRDKTELVFDYSRSAVNNISSDLDNLILSVADKMQLVASLSRNKSIKADITRILEKDENIVSMHTSANLEKLSKEIYKSSTFFKTYAVDDTGFLQKIKVPKETILEQGEVIWSVENDQNVPLIGYAKSVVEEDSRGKAINQYAIVALLKPNKLVEAIERNRFSDVIIVRNDKKIILGKSDFAQFENLYNQASIQQIRTSVFKYDFNKTSYLGAYSKSQDGKLYILSLVSEQKAFAAVNRLVYRSVLFASIVLTLAFIAAILFSRTLTKPIEKLVVGMKEVSDGDLDVQINVESKDEISLLANSFNGMIADLKQSRKDLEEINRDLEKKVKERTLQLEKQNQAVKSAQEALLRTTRLASVGEIAGRAAHEVLNPLTNIMTRVQKVKSQVEDNDPVAFLKEVKDSWKSDYESGGFDKLVETWKSPSQVNENKNIWEEDVHNIEQVEQQIVGKTRSLLEDIDFLIKEGHRINRIVQSMRSLSVVNSDQKAHSVESLVDESVNIMADLASQYSCQIKISQVESDIRVKVDFDEFIQSLTNMLRNSIQSVASRRKNEGESYSGQIEISTEVNDGRVKIRVSDNGDGIDKENIPRLFENHFTTKSREEGTGLGLNISRRFIRSFNGDIYLEKTEKSAGSTFIIELPVLRQEKVSA